VIRGKKKGRRGKIRRKAVRLLWRAAAPWLKPLRLPRAHIPTKQKTRHITKPNLAHKTWQDSCQVCKFADNVTRHVSLDVDDAQGSTLQKQAKTIHAEEVLTDDAALFAAIAEKFDNV